MTVPPHLLPPRPGVDDATLALRTYSDHPSGYLALNRTTSWYMCPRVPGLIAHRPGRHQVIQFAGPFAAPADRGRLLDEFLFQLHAGRFHKPQLTAVQLQRRHVALYERRDFTVNQLGSTYGIDLTRFELRGKPLAKVRQNVNRARREGVTVTEAHSGDLGQHKELDAIDAAWLRAKGRHVRPLTFLVGERGGPGAPLRRTFVARRQGRTVGYITYSPVWGSRPGWLYDLTRRSPHAPVGTVELINLTALTRFQDEGAGWLHLGLTPCAGLADEHEPASASRTLTRALRAVADHGQALYPVRTQEAFKRKWAPHLIEPEYVAFQNGVRPRAIGRLLKVTGVL
ncbi:phosphatidylglycerol lysyltransferase domain-containing protein [Streptomyces flavofungini]|uniref:phosphatidylglycerol lysyltransferase domain-containing protein n=1 Tax=Streptomyces flavofungini TaxID=68200 RepID=UPI0034DF64F1